MIYNAIIDDPAPVQAAMHDYQGNPFVGDGPCYLDLTVATGLARSDYDMSSAGLKESLAGKVCEISVTLKQPSAAFLVASAGKFLLIWTDYNCAAGKGRVLGFGMINPLPSSLGNAVGRVDVKAYCRLIGWQLSVHDAMRGAVTYDRLFYDAENGPSTADLMSCSSTVPTIDRRSLGVVLRQSYAAIDADSTRAAGNVSQGGVVAYDVTDYALANGFDIREGQSEPIAQLNTKIQIAWNQYWAGTCDLGGLVTIALGSLEGLTHLRTYTPNEFKSSIPRAGQSIGTGWTALKANFLAADGMAFFERSDAEAEVAAQISAGYQVQDAGFVQVPTSVVYLQAGANAGFIAWGEYTQPRRETLVMSSTLDIDTRFLGGLAPMQGAKIALADPTTPQSGGAWLPSTPYGIDDVAWYGGLRQHSKVDQVSGTTFDQTLWESEAADPTDVPALFGVYRWFPNVSYAAGDCVYDPSNPANFYYRNFNGISPALGTGGGLATFSLDATNWTQGPTPHQALNITSWQYLDSARGLASLKHLDQRHYATLLSAARCVEAVFRLRFDDLLDATSDYRAMDLTVGKCLRVRTQSLTSGVNEVIGVVTDLEILMTAEGAGAVSVTLGLIPGNGMTSGAATTTLGATVGTYVYGTPRVPVDVTNLSNPGYACNDVTMLGTDFTSQGNLIQAAINAATGAATIASGIVTAIGDANVNRLRISMRPLIQEGLIPLVHPTMMMQPKTAPRNIEFAT